MKKMRHDDGYAVLSHQAMFGSLQAYADGTLEDLQRARVDAHLRTCAECQERMHQIERLELVLTDLPPMPPVAFSRFWSRLEPRLANHTEKRVRFFRPARLAASLALAVLASLVGVVALASDGVMPDSPLYSVKHFRQGVQLTLAGGTERPRLELVLGKQRLHEALVMVKRKRHDLAVASLRDFHALLVDAAPRLENSSTGKLGAAALSSTVADLKTQLDAVSDANVAQGGIDSADIAAVDGAVLEDLSAVSQVETGVDNAAPEDVASPASPSSSPAESQSPAPSEPPSPDASASAAPSGTVPDNVAPSPAA